MTYKVVLIKHEEGYTVMVPALPGCISEGRSEAEALENIRDAIEAWLEYHQSEGKALEFYPLEDVRIAEVDVSLEPTLG